MTLSFDEYAYHREAVVLAYVILGRPGATCVPLGDPERIDRLGWLDLTGAVDDADVWRWDGAGEPADAEGHVIAAIRAYVDRSRWLGA